MHCIVRLYSIFQIATHGTYTQKPGSNWCDHLAFLGTWLFFVAVAYPRILASDVDHVPSIFVFSKSPRSSTISRDARMERRHTRQEEEAKERTKSVATRLLYICTMCFKAHIHCCSTIYPYLRRYICVYGLLESSLFSWLLASMADGALDHEESNRTSYLHPKALGAVVGSQASVIL